MLQFIGKNKYFIHGFKRYSALQERIFWFATVPVALQKLSYLSLMAQRSDQYFWFCLQRLVPSSWEGLSLGGDSEVTLEDHQKAGTMWFIRPLHRAVNSDVNRLELADIYIISSNIIYWLAPHSGTAQIPFDHLTPNVIHRII